MPEAVDLPEHDTSEDEVALAVFLRSLDVGILARISVASKSSEGTKTGQLFLDGAAAITSAIVDGRSDGRLLQLRTARLST